MKTWKLWLRLIGYAPGTLAAMLGLLSLRMLIQFAPALVIREMFDRLPRAGGLSLELQLLAALLVGVGLAQVGIFVWATWVECTFRDLVSALLRQNAIEGIYHRPGAEILPMPIGDMVMRLGPGVLQVTRPLVSMLIQSVNALAVLIAVSIMGRTNLLLTGVTLAPLVVAAGLAHYAGARMVRLRHASLAAEGQVGSFLREIFDAVQLVQVAGAEARAAERFARLSEARRSRVLQETLFQDVLLASLLQNVSYLSTGLLLLLSWRYLLAGSFSISDFALFTYFLPVISDFSTSIGQFYAWYKQSGAAFARLSEPVTGRQAAGTHPPDAPSIAQPGQSAAALVYYQPVYLTGNVPDLYAPAPSNPEVPLASLEVRGLTCLHPGSGRGIENISFTLKGGSFSAITGRVGAGKTTLLRALLGLLPLDGGEIRWNGQVVEHPAQFFTPPRSVYVRQAPGLFSATLRENILLDEPGDRLDRAIQAAVLERDLPTLENSLDTLVGPRGVKLSGGQILRAAAARAIARPASLLVLDDLSSALDVETEKLLWSRLRALPLTILVVTHRREALKQADKIIVLKDGQLEAEGTLEALLESCAEMKALIQEYAKKLN